LRRLYSGIQADPVFEALTVSEAVKRETAPAVLHSIVPGSWINANFDVWIGAPEDNLAWDFLSAAREFFTEHSDQAAPEQKNLAYEELLIAEGSDWNWWYGPEHHSANDRDFDELYRKHLANVYHALGASPPHALAQPITVAPAKPRFTPQTAYIHPLIDGKDIGYFDWVGAATYVAEQHSSSMHGKVLVLETGYVGVDEHNLYCRADFIDRPADWGAAETKLIVTVEPLHDAVPGPICRLEAEIAEGRLRTWIFARNGQTPETSTAASEAGISVSIDSLFECKIPLAAIETAPGSTLRVRFALWRDNLPLDTLPHEGSIEVRMVSEDELSALAYAKP
jgi:hypothetical protein